ncbi:MarR family winged helix-turn-helix transcriptional regulator [Sphingomonas sp.]|uniref:MarR family winged helix-turn-helix transcriptional regulator n=1 Tax=Sphingomonas sp. TaxID=28214 RepID=UPI000DB73836|nr:MarR family winged helix-turn-helix transcriptional regulator [Sphingomonas sp.]PZU07959.1 MAG: MarR family transcriptional regulator [Sphingomonas sp.]
MSNPNPCACTVLRKTSRAVTRFYDEAIAASGLSISQFALLRTLGRMGPTPLSQLAEEMVMERTSLYRMIAPLEARGLVSVTQGAGRARVAALAPEGRTIIDGIAGTWDATQARFVRALGEEKWQALRVLLADATRAAEEIAA